MRRKILFVLLVLLCLVPATQAQDEAQAVSGSGVEITWPPPISEVWGAGEVLGTAAVPGMAYYYLEYIPLNEDLTVPESAPWLPVTVAIDRPVIDGPLALLDTTQVPDGLYALRLVVNTLDNQSFFDTVSPVRVSNERFTRITGQIAEQTIADAIAQLEAAGIDIDALLNPPTPEPTPLPVDTTPRVVPGPGITAANVRRCDLVDNYRCAMVGALDANGAVVSAISANGTGWYQIVLPSGLVGWVSPTVVSTIGDFTGVPFVAPPAPLPPPARPNVVLNGISLMSTPVCNSPFNVNINISNLGNAVSDAGTITLQDVNLRTGEVTFSTSAGFPGIGPGGAFVVVIPVLTTVYYDETHELRAYVGDQNIRQQYVLERGLCNVEPMPMPVFPPAATPR
jgi:hypothetical protein